MVLKLLQMMELNISAFMSNYNKISKILSLEKNIIIKDENK